MSALRFQDKVAIVTGGCQGIGRGCVDVLVENGGKVVVFDIKDDIGKTMSVEKPGELVYMHCDVTKEEEIKKSVEAVIQRFGKLDCLVNNVGIHQGPKTIDDISVESFRELLEVNLISTFAMSKHFNEASSLSLISLASEDITSDDFWKEAKYALPHLRKSSGSIVNISSNAAYPGIKNSSTYCATKGGVKSITKALAIDEAKYGVRVNSIAPGAVETDLLKQLAPEEQRIHLAKCHTLGRLAQPREIGLACLFLAVDATFTTGEELFCTGGLEIGYGVKDPNSLF